MHNCSTYFYFYFYLFIYLFVDFDCWYFIWIIRYVYIVYLMKSIVKENAFLYLVLRILWCFKTKMKWDFTFFYPNMVHKLLFWSPIFKIEILIEFHGLKSPESENHIFSGMCVYVCVCYQHNNANNFLFKIRQTWIFNFRLWRNFGVLFRWASSLTRLI